MKVAIMQPYIFPYLGYFQLINAVDKFIFYDDVNFIKRGWINRNQILINKQANLFSVPIIKASQNKTINESLIALDQKWIDNFLSTIEQNYKKAPHFEIVFELIKSIFRKKYLSIADLNIESITAVSNLLEITTSFDRSSENYFESKGMDKADRLIEICLQCKSEDYINPSGGKELYDKSYFKNKNINLSFIENQLTPYPQFGNEFIGGLSIIDVLMFNSIENIRHMLNQYELI